MFLLENDIIRTIGSFNEFRVLAALSSFTQGRTGRCWPSLPKIAERSGLPRENVCRAIKKLIEAGLVSRVDDAEARKHRSTTYLLSELVYPRQGESTSPVLMAVEMEAASTSDNLSPKTSDNLSPKTSDNLSPKTSDKLSLRTINRTIHRTKKRTVVEKIDEAVEPERSASVSTPPHVPIEAKQVELLPTPKPKAKTKSEPNPDAHVIAREMARYYELRFPAADKPSDAWFKKNTQMAKTLLKHAKVDEIKLRMARVHNSYSKPEFFADLSPLRYNWEKWATTERRVLNSQPRLDEAPKPQPSQADVDDVRAMLAGLKAPNQAAA